MTHIKDISETIMIETTTDAVKVTLNAKQYQLDRLEQYQLFLTQKKHLLSGQIVESSEEKLVIQYQKSKQIYSLQEYLKRTELFQRLLLAQKINFLSEFLSSPIQPFIHPANLFLFGEEIIVAHRGFAHSIIPYEITEEEFLKQYRALILTILHPKFDYEQLIEGNGTLKDEFSKRIQRANSVAEIDRMIGEQVVQQKTKRASEIQMVNKRSYFMFKWGTLLLSISTIGLALTTGIYAFDKLPAQERISSAETQYIANNYAGVLTTLKDDKPEDLPSGAQYVAAVSAVQLDNLSNEQKTAILNNISQKSNENTLLYWIYIGRGDFERSLDIAQNLGDHQYILHAYTKLYDATRANNKMSGQKKQELLTSYEEEINKYLEILESETDSNEAN
ncbi:type VII secretion protein EssB [Enterococcus mundtii]|nr:type VII secretion protein EssB [Enterococcus mundtii]MDB7101955.1 type VII secretion protein EssB [Enterococcus mundtii]